MNYHQDTQTHAGSRRIVTAFFEDRSDAERAVERLTAAGIPQDAIRFVAGSEAGQGQQRESSGGFLDALVDLFLPDEDSATYAEGLRRGGYLVSASVHEGDYERALDILDDEGTIDIGERERSWRAEGWSGTGSMSGSTASTMRGATSDARREGEEVIPVAEEELRVGKRDVSHGRVRVRSYVVETPVNETVRLKEENVRVERRPADRAVSGGDDLFRERTIELEERAEEAVVAKEARVREELVVKKDIDERTETISDTVRRTEVEIDDDRETVPRRRAR
jgi:uncharacterized protein (TIGR02271 family)